MQRRALITALADAIHRDDDDDTTFDHRYSQLVARVGEAAAETLWLTLCADDQIDAASRYQEEQRLRAV